MLDEFITESYRIPWLIWIQLIVLFLLLALFYIFIFDDDDAATVSNLPESSSASSKGFLFEEIQQIDSIAPVSTNPQHRNITQQQDGQNLSIAGEIATCSNMRSGEINEGESSTLSSHTCHFFQLATVAFLKCFGLDSTSDSSSNQKCRKRKES